jgi:SNF2 family DNA or RNA helicase
MPAIVKDRRPKMPGSARAFALMQRHLRLDKRVMRDGTSGAPMVHQADGLGCMMQEFEETGSFGLLHDMGCGKTLTMIAALMVLHEDGDARTMLVACPKSVVGSWQKEIEDLNERRGAEVVEVLALTQAGVPKREAALQRCLLDRSVRESAGERVPPLIVAVNYESTFRMETMLRAARFDVVAADESQRIKAPGSKQSLAMFRIGKAAKYNVLMTGTPVPEGGLDWYGQWRFADHELFGTNYGNFKARFAIEIECTTKAGTSFRKVTVNPHTKHILESSVMERVHRVSKEEAVDLPEQTNAIIEFDMTTRQRRVYDDLVEDSISFLERHGNDADMSGEFGEVVGDNPLTRMLRLQQICGGYVQLDGVEGVVRVDPKKPNPKLAVLVDLAETLRDAGSSLVVFYRFTHEGEAIVEALNRLAGKNSPVSLINGSVSGGDRKGMIDRFQNGDTPFFVGQIQACAEGITLHRAADTALYSMPFASAVYLQALARVHRIGQNQSCNCHHHLLAQALD